MDSLHVICGESVCSETAAWLKVGTTALVVAMIEGGVRIGDGLRLRSPVEAMRAINRELTCQARVEMLDGSTRTALEVQRGYLAVAEASLGAPFMPDWAEAVCERWRSTLSLLEGDPAAAGPVLDWRLKLGLCQYWAERRGMSWDEVQGWSDMLAQLSRALRLVDFPDDVQASHVLSRRSPIAGVVRALDPQRRALGLDWDRIEVALDVQRDLYLLDTRFAELGPRGIFASLDADGAGTLRHHVPGVDRVEKAVTTPPAGSRAAVRGDAVARLCGNPSRYRAGWQGVFDTETGQTMDLSDPFATRAEWRAETPRARRPPWRRRTRRSGVAGEAADLFSAVLGPENALGPRR